MDSDLIFVQLSSQKSISFPDELVKALDDHEVSISLCIVHIPVYAVQMSWGVYSLNLCVLVVCMTLYISIYVSLVKLRGNSIVYIVC